MKATPDVKPLLELGAGLRVIDADAAETAIVLAVAKGSSGPTSSKLSSKPENRLKRSSAVNKRVAAFRTRMTVPLTIVDARPRPNPHVNNSHCTRCKQARVGLPMYMDDLIESLTEVGDGPALRHRLAKTVLPNGVTSIVGETLVLQLASGSSQLYSQNTMGVHIGYVGIPPRAATRVITAAAEKLSAISCLPAATATPTKLVGNRGQPGPLTDPAVKLTVVTDIEQASACVQQRLVDAIDGVIDQPADVPSPTGAIAVTHTATPADTQRVRDVLPVSPTLADRLALVAGVRSDEPVATLDPCESVGDVTPIADSLLKQFFEAVWEQPVETSKGARVLAKEYQDMIAVRPAHKTYVPTPTPKRIITTVRRFASAVARLQLESTITADHVQTAIRLFEATLPDQNVRVQRTTLSGP